jgi:hypothetical protein
MLQVSLKSHAYLRNALWDRQPGSYTHNVSARYAPQNDADRREVSGHPSHRPKRHFPSKLPALEASSNSAG